MTNQEMGITSNHTLIDQGNDTQPIKHTHAQKIHKSRYQNICNKAHIKSNNEAKHTSISGEQV